MRVVEQLELRGLERRKGFGTVVAEHNAGHRTDDVAGGKKREGQSEGGLYCYWGVEFQLISNLGVEFRLISNCRETILSKIHSDLEL